MFICRKSADSIHQITSIVLQKKRCIQNSIKYHVNCNSQKNDVFRRRVVVTGVGIVSPVGCNIKSAWMNILNGYCGITTISDDKYQTLPCKIAAKINDTDLKIEEHLSKSELRSISSATAYAIIAGKL